MPKIAGVNHLNAVRALEKAGFTIYENQTDDEEAAEIEATLKAENITLMDIPTELVPKVRALLARKRSA